MNPDTLLTIFDIGAAVARQIFNAVSKGEVEELRRLADVWPEPMKSRLALLEVEAKARRRAAGGG